MYCNTIRLLTRELYNAIYPNLSHQHYYSTAAVTASLGKKKKLGKMGAVIEKKIHPVETDSNILVNFVCGSNIYKDGQDVELKPDSEYPAWLWELDTGKPQPLEELDKNSKKYWLRVRKMAIIQHHKLKSLQKW